MRVRADGKVFSLGDRIFPFHGVTYGTFAPRPTDGARFPSRSQMASDFGAKRDAGFTVVRTYTAPPEDLLRKLSPERSGTPDWV